MTEPTPSRKTVRPSSGWTCRTWRGGSPEPPRASGLRGPLIDDKHRIAHDKVILIDETTIVTGSFNFTKGAEEDNAENLLIIDGKPKLMAAYQESFKEHLEHSHEYKGPSATSWFAAASRACRGKTVHKGLCAYQRSYRTVSLQSRSFRSV
jgi:phosphatidylserine/phosphatidylglycerophosphate/cardiolipin synthase-like enzyme